MKILDELPEHFPGKELSLKNGEVDSSGYIYEINYVDYTHTTSCDLIATPEIWYRSLSFVDPTRWDKPYLDSVASKIGIGLLNEGQQSALRVAEDINRQRTEQDPTRNTFANLREIKQSGERLLYFTQTEEGAMLQGAEPMTAVKSARIIGFIDFATITHDYYGVFMYDKADLNRFIPDEMRDTVNSYMIIDMPRVVVGENSEHDYQIARLALFEALADLDYPAETIQPLLKS